MMELNSEQIAEEDQYRAYLHEKLREIRTRYEAEMQPFIRELIRIEELRPKPVMMLDPSSISPMVLQVLAQAEELPPPG